jgi:hypothetical protein
MSQANIKQFIQSAEKFIVSGKLDLAIDQLTLAQNLEPQNKYIMAIMDRVETLRQRQASNTSTLQAVLGDSSLSNLAGSDPLLTSENIQAQIRQLTTIAENFLENGSCENAFESLMKAYLLDPISPYVMACERTVLPAWESSKTGKAQPPRQGTYHDHPLTTVLGRSITMLENNNGIPPIKNDESTTPLPVDQTKRLEVLKQQKEAQRLATERARWREASKPPKVFGEHDIPSPTGTTEGSEPARESTGGFFSRLMRGRLLK